MLLPLTPNSYCDLCGKKISIKKLDVSIKKGFLPKGFFNSLDCALPCFPTYAKNHCCFSVRKCQRAPQKSPINQILYYLLYLCGKKKPSFSKLVNPKKT